MFSQFTWLCPRTFRGLWREETGRQSRKPTRRGLHCFPRSVYAQLALCCCLLQPLLISYNSSFSQRAALDLRVQLTATMGNTKKKNNFLFTFHFRTPTITMKAEGVKKRKRLLIINVYIIFYCFTCGSLAAWLLDFGCHRHWVSVLLGKFVA